MYIGEFEVEDISSDEREERAVDQQTVYPQQIHSKEERALCHPTTLSRVCDTDPCLLEGEKDGYKNECVANSGDAIDENIEPVADQQGGEFFLNKYNKFHSCYFFSTPPFRACNV